MNAQVRRLLDYLESQPGGVTDDEEEFTEDLARYVRTARAQTSPDSLDSIQSDTRARGHDSGEVRLPYDLEQRITRWHRLRLGRLQPLIDISRQSLGFESVPFPEDVKLVDELWTWLTRRRKFGFARAAPSEAVARALSTLRPRNPLMRPEDIDDAARKRFFEGALGGIRNTTTCIAEELGCVPIHVARWLLAGVEPPQQCLVTGMLSTTVGPNVFTVRVNPDVVTPEELRTVYRRACTHLDASAPDRFYKFFSPLAFNHHLSQAEQVELWNELHPRHAYKNVNSFRAALHKAKRKNPDIGRRW
jgi:hypothetical protein